MIRWLKSWWRSRKAVPPPPRRTLMHFASGPFGWPVCGANTYQHKTVEFGPAVTCPTCRRDGALMVADWAARTR